jgi:Iap family predicted aminopeptidase
MPVRRFLFSVLRITTAVVAVITLLWWFGVRMPGKNVSNTAALTPAEVTLRNELIADVRVLGGDIGERNMARYQQLIAAADFIENSFRRAGFKPRRDSYDLHGHACHNIEAEIRGSSPQIVVIGAHYDSVFGAPGANDNGSGVAALLALARRFAARAASAQAATAAASTSSTMRFVAFVNEEPPYCQTSQMGSFIYAGRCKARGNQITAMISLETIGYFSDAPHSQTYPAPGLGMFYPTIGNFIGFVANTHSRALLHRVMSIFRAQRKLPSEGAALLSFIPGVAWSDQWSFWQHGYPGIMVTDTAPFRYPYYHSATDTPDKLDYDRCALVVSGMEKVIEDLVRHRTDSRWRAGARPDSSRGR